MLIACWSAKGGAGSTVVSASLALRLSDQRDVLVADLAGDIPAVLGAPEPDSAGLLGWLQANAAHAALERIEDEIRPGLSVLPRGQGDLTGPRHGGDQLAAALLRDGRHVVADCGVLRAAEPTAATALADAAEHSWLVIRPDYLSLRHATRAPIRPTAAVVVQQPGRSLGRGDVERVLEVPVIAIVDDDPAAARAVDAGLLSGRLPRCLERGMRSAGASIGLDAAPRVGGPAAGRISPPEASL